MEDAREDLGCPLTSEELPWLLASLSSLFRLPFDGALVESQFPPPHTRASFHESARALGFKTGNYPLSRASWSGLPLPCIAFLKSATAMTDPTTATSPADHPVPVLIITSDAHKVLFFRASSQTAETFTTKEAASVSSPIASSLPASRVHGEVFDGRNDNGHQRRIFSDVAQFNRAYEVHTIGGEKDVRGKRR